MVRSGKVRGPEGGVGRGIELQRVRCDGIKGRHGRACPGHPPLADKTWMRGSSPGSSPIGANLRSSLPGLTRQSIDLRKNFLAKKMDARVKILCRRSGRGGTSAVPNHH